MTTAEPSFNQVARYNALMDVVANRLTNRAFDPEYVVPDEHYKLILEAARHGPSGANAQPWHYIVVKDPAMKEKLGDTFLVEQNRRAKLGMKFPTPNYKGMKTAPGLILVAGDFRFIRAFPVMNDDSELDRKYKVNAERILLQSVAASVMSAPAAFLIAKIMLPETEVSATGGKVETNHRNPVSEKVGDLTFNFLAGDFFQNNPFILPTFTAYAAEEAAGKGQRYLLDAYCGSGLFALSLAAHNWVGLFLKKIK